MWAWVASTSQACPKVRRLGHGLQAGMHCPAALLHWAAWGGVLRLLGACPQAGQQELAQQLQAALQVLEQVREAALPVGIDAANILLASHVTPLLEPAGRLAALVQAFYQQPEQAAAAALELAQAAATLSCANLRCANVAGEGRKAEGRPNQRCSACRAVRYCCRECSVVDWKAGHKRVCAALAAAATQAGAGAAEQQA